MIIYDILSYLNENKWLQQEDQKNEGKSKIKMN